MLMVSVNELRTYINAPAGDDEFLGQCLETAADLISEYLDGAYVPEAVIKQAGLIAAGDIYQRRSSPQGLSQFATQDGMPIRVPKDPLNGTYPLLQQYVEVGL